MAPSLVKSMPGCADGQRSCTPVGWAQQHRVNFRASDAVDARGVMSKGRILAVDDQRYFREQMERLLVEEGYEVHSCASGEEALHLLEREDFDVVVTDLVMPGIDGVELLRRTKERLPEQDVVMVTGVVDVKVAVGAMKLGAIDYIMKPFDRSKLVDSIDKIFEDRRLRSEHARLLDENLGFMELLSLVERAASLFPVLGVGQLSEQLIEGLCFETRAQSGVLWLAERPTQEQFTRTGVRGLVRSTEVPTSVTLSDVEENWCPGLSKARSVLSELRGDHGVGEALYLPIRVGQTILGVARLSDKLGDEHFTADDREHAEKFCDFAGVAAFNALRFRAVERRALRDPETNAYSRAYFEDAIRNEIQKANRFGHRFSIVRLESDDWSTHDTGGGSDLNPLFAEAARRLGGTLRSTDVMAEADEGAFQLLLPQTDALGAGVLGQRVREALAAQWEGREAPVVRLAGVSFPADGTRLEGLQEMLRTRVSEARESLLIQRPELAQGQGVDPLFDRMLELGTIESIEVEGQILKFVLEDVVRRPAERGVLFLSPGARWLPDVFEILEEIRDQPTRTEIVLLADGEARELHPQVTCITKVGLDPRRPFVVYFGDGPAYAMIGQITLAEARTAVFQTADRVLVEHLAFELQRELEIVLPG